MSEQLPMGFIFLGKRRLGPFRTSGEADLVLYKLDFNDEVVYEGLLEKHGPAYLMLSLPQSLIYTLYHVTPVSRVSQILDSGLRVDTKPYHTMLHDYLEFFGIYLGDSFSSIEGFLCEPEGEPVELLEVHIPWDWTLWIDPETAELRAYLASTASFYISKENIPPSRVNVASESVKIEAFRRWRKIYGA